MGQFDSEVDAVQHGLRSDELSASVISRIPSEILEIGQVLCEIAEGAAVSPFNKTVASGLKYGIGALRAVASQRFEHKVELLLEGLQHDARGLSLELSRQGRELAVLKDLVQRSRFEEIIAEASVQAARASTESRIGRLARIAISGSFIFPELNTETVLDFERYGVELTENDIGLLEFLAKHLPAMTESNRGYFDESGWAEQIRHGWLNLPRSDGGGYAGIGLIDARSSFARLQSRGLITQLSWGTISAGAGADPYGVLRDGRVFLTLIREPQK